MWQSCSRMISQMSSRSKWLKSLSTILSWITKRILNAGNLILWQTFSRFVLIGWKLDLENDRKVSVEDAQKLAHEYNMLFYETSAKEWTNIDEIFQNLAKELVESAIPLKSLLLSSPVRGGYLYKKIAAPSPIKKLVFFWTLY